MPLYTIVGAVMVIDDHAEGLLRRHDRRRRWPVIPGATTCHARCW